MSLIEILVSIVMIGGLIVLFAAAQNVVSSTRKLKNENVAYHIASKKMEELRGVPYDSLPASASFSDPQLSQLTNSSANYTIADYSSYDGMKQIVVTVTWMDGGSRNISVSTLVGSGGINP